MGCQREVCKTAQASNWPATEEDWNDEAIETKIHQDRRCRRPGGDDSRGARHRPVDARGQMASDGELAEVARYALRQSRISCQTHRRADRQQVSDPGVC